MVDQLTISFKHLNISLRTQNAPKMRQKMKNKQETPFSISSNCTRIHPLIPQTKKIINFNKSIRKAPLTLT